MDVVFSCTSCRQELIVAASGSGSEIECPACNTSLIVPEADAANVHTVAPIETSAAAKMDVHFKVPQHDGPVETLIKGSLPTLEVAKDGERKVRVKTIRRSDCVEVGKDRFDDTVSDFLQRVGEKHVISINAVNYMHEDLATKAMISDYGVLIVYKG